MHWAWRKDWGIPSDTDHRQGRLQVSEGPQTVNPTQTNRITSERAPSYTKDQNWPQAHPGVRIFPWNEVTALHYTKLFRDQQRPDYQAMMKREADDWEAQDNHQVRRKPWALPVPSSVASQGPLSRSREVAEQEGFLKKVLQQALQIHHTNPGFVLTCQFNSTSRYRPCWVGSERNMSSETL